MSPSESHELLLETTLELIDSLEPLLPSTFSGAAGAAHRARAAAPRAAGGAAARWLPVLRVVPQLAAPVLPVHRLLIESLRRAAPELEWRQTYTDLEVDRGFLENYAWTELIGPRAGHPAAELAVGLLLLGPHTTYPPHRHEAEEIYLPVSGAAEWCAGQGVWTRRAPGALIHHAREEIHAMRTAAEPLLALYLWRSRDLGQQASLVRGVA
jgi:quercetin dioxygenase-like cupin family protein